MERREFLIGLGGASLLAVTGCGDTEDPPVDSTLAGTAAGMGNAGMVGAGMAASGTTAAGTGAGTAAAGAGAAGTNAAGTNAQAGTGAGSGAAGTGSQRSDAGTAGDGGGSDAGAASDSGSAQDSGRDAGKDAGAAAGCGGAITAQITCRHDHALVVPMADLMGDQDREYDIRGANTTHGHMVTITAAHFAQLRDGETVEIYVESAIQPHTMYLSCATDFDSAARDDEACN